MSHDVSVGIVADWLVTFAGSEKVIAEFIKLYPNADIYSVVDFLSDESRKKFYGKKRRPLLYSGYLLRRRNISSICL